MRRTLKILMLLIALAGCATMPSPSTRPNPTDSASSPPSPGPTPSPSPSASPTSGLVTARIGTASVTYPAEWRLAAGPAGVGNQPVPLFYLSDAPLAIEPCPTPNPKTGEFAACPPPMPELPPNGVLVMVSPNLGLAALIPPRVVVNAADPPCRRLGGKEMVWAVVGGMVVDACLRGPELAAHEAQVRAFVTSLTATP